MHPLYDSFLRRHASDSSENQPEHAANQRSAQLFGGSIETSLPASSDYWKRDNLFSLRYCNWNKDMFMGILPNSQFGDIAVVDVTGVTGSSHVKLWEYYS